MTNYDADLLLWATEQATLLRDGRLSEVDRLNVAEELDSLAHAMQRELAARFMRLLQNLMQWEYLPLIRLPAWYIVIQDERSAIPRLLADAPCLQNSTPVIFAVAWKDARQQASYATGLAIVAFPREATYTFEQALDAAFWPEGQQ